MIDHLVHACGLRLAPEAQRPSTAHQAEGSSALHDTLEPGKIVFVYRGKQDTVDGRRHTGFEGQESGVGSLEPEVRSQEYRALRTDNRTSAPQGDRIVFRKLAA